MSELQGKIVKGIGGFYYVETADGLYECKARGVLRKDKKKPLVGDDALVEVLSREKMLGNLVDILPRHSELIRPAVANVDQALIIFAVKSPAPPLNLLDRFLVNMERQNIPTIICFNKEDLDGETGNALCNIYRQAGYECLLVSAKEGKGLEELRTLISGKTTTVAGPSGVGKSSLINAIFGGNLMETGSISEKIERGKHTTRHSEFLSLGNQTFILDTPGFSSLELFDVEKEELGTYYPEFSEPEKECRFALCSHIHEPGCGVKAAVGRGEISNERYENYCLLYEELKAKRKY